MRRRARTPGFPPARPPAEERLGPLGGRLSAIGFAEERIAERLSGAHPAGLALERFPVYRALLERRPDALATAIALFLLQGEAPHEAVEEGLGADATEDALALGLLVPAGRKGRGGTLAAAASIFPCAGGLFATDHRHRAARARAAGPAPREPVMSLGGDSYALAYLAPAPRAGARVLDLCTGSGVHAILALRGGADRAIATDVNPRALAFARFNAALNGVAARLEVRRGDLWDAVREGERFDLVLANPPFVPSPHGPRSRVRLAFRDAGPSGEDVLARLLAGLPGRLERDGIAAIVSVFADAQRRPLRRKLEEWLGPRANLDALLLEMGTDLPEEYAAAQTRRAFEDDPAAYAERYGRWLAALRRARIERLAGGVLALRRHAGPTPPGFRALPAGPPPARPDRRRLGRALDAFAAARAIVFPEELLERRARRADDLVLGEEMEVRDGALAPARFRARTQGGVGGEVGISADLRAVLAAATGERPLRDVIEDLAGARGVDPAEAAARLFPDLIELGERGLLLLGPP